MTQTDNAPSAEQIRDWLAAQPCPRCGGIRVICGHPHEVRSDFHTGDPICDGCQDASGKPTGLAFEWASVPCPGDSWGACKKPRLGKCHRCGGSGRVPKDVGLAELFKHGIIGVKRFAVYTYKAQHVNDPLLWTGDADTPTLAALRAICNSLKP